MKEISLEVCNEVTVEPSLQEVTNERMMMRSAITTERAIWGGRYVNLRRCQGIHAPINRKSTLAQCYRKHELEKIESYEQRITEVEHASFTPIVLSR